MLCVFVLALSKSVSACVKVCVCKCKCVYVCVRVCMCVRVCTCVRMLLIYACLCIGLHHSIFVVADGDVYACGAKGPTGLRENTEVHSHKITNRE